MLSLELVADTQDRDAAVSAFYDGSDWLWRRAHAAFTTRGGTLIELLENAEGQFNASGTYLGAEELPLTLYAQFTSKRGLMGVDAFELEMGESKVTDSVWTDDNWRDEEHQQQGHEESAGAVAPLDQGPIEGVVAAEDDRPG